MKKVTNTKMKAPIFSGGLLVDGITKGDNNKINAQGVFSIFWAWGYPAQRNCAAIFNVAFLPRGASTLLFSIRHKRQSSLTIVGSIDMENKGIDLVSIITTPLSFQFIQEGEYELKCQLKNRKSYATIPFVVKTRDWPVFTENEIEFARKKKNPVLNMRANIRCKDCSYVYIFEETVLPDQIISPGAVRFPESGIYPCKNCSHDLLLKDIQGQLRATLKDLLKKSIGGS